MPKNKVPKTSMAEVLKKRQWNRLRNAIGAYANAAVAESWKGGGDPADAESLTLLLKLRLAELDAIIVKMERDGV